MIAELFTNNALNLVIIFGSCAALILMSFWFRRGNRKRKGFLFHAVQFLIYTIIISACLLYTSDAADDVGQACRVREWRRCAKKIKQ